MKIYLKFQQQTITINCGPGGQNIGWLYEMACLKQEEEENYLRVDDLEGVQTEEGVFLDLRGCISEVLKDR